MTRYSRQTRFQPIGEAGQARFATAKVLIIGMGALGTASAEQLVRAGVGVVRIVDRDYVEWSNLQRQQLYTEDDARHSVPKAIAAKARLEAINSTVTIEAHVLDVDRAALTWLLDDIDLIIDATDHFDIRLLMNDMALLRSIPWIYGGCIGSYGITFTVRPGETPCLQCLLDQLPRDQETCDTAGIIGPAVQMVASLQVTEALKWLSGKTDALRTRLLAFDVWSNTFQQINVQSLKQTECPSCGIEPSYPYLSNQTVRFTALCGRDAVQIRGDGQRDLEQLKQRLQPVASISAHNPYLLAFTTDEHRMVAFRDGRVLIHGEADLVKAKRLYHAYFG
ncbi:MULTISPECIES: ThiF family adenylyltransferase [unclassified Exiguobacterium]|uniref:ThiF family adenylyltransferase n=1 Tax=unclassified Exiguobacterium TaxID=2644629 RepID=UPI0025C48006|nr:MULTISPECIES: ThiF family adenylyltransferase [unclassified Exiguobacterium]